MDPDYLRYESFENLYVETPLKWGLLCFNQAHQKREVLKLTTDIDEILSLLKKGWEKHAGRNQYILRSPEKVLCDLSEREINPTDNLDLLVDYYTFLKNINLASLIREIKRENKHIKDLEIIPLTNHIFTSEVRVAASDQRIDVVPGLIFEYYLKTKGIKNVVTNKKLPNKLSAMDIFVKNFYQEIRRYYRKIGCELVQNPEIPEMDFWDKFRGEYDIYVFIPKSAIRYCLSFLNRVGIEYLNKVCLWEYHTGNDTNKELVIFKKNICDKRVLVVDRSFSSYTLTHLSQKIKENGAEIVDRLAIFPKSQAAILNSEYCFFWHSLLKSQKVDLSGEWALRLFKKVNHSI